jgi:hypothetical protein
MGVVAFFTLGMLLIQSIADVLALITDEFDHYDGDAPEDNAATTDPDDLGVVPDENCTADGQQSEQAMVQLVANAYVNGNPSLESVKDCAESDTGLAKVVKILDTAVLVATLAATVVVPGATAVGCATGGIWGCVAGFTTSSAQLSMALTVADFVGLISSRLTCAGGIAGDVFVTKECAQSMFMAYLGMQISNPVVDAAIDSAVVLCLDSTISESVCGIIPGSG